GARGPDRARRSRSACPGSRAPGPGAHERRGTPNASALEQLDHDLAEQQRTVRAIHERLYFRPLLEAFTSSGATAMSPEAAAARLAAFGFADAARTRQALDELTRGLTRSSRLMQQLMPLLLEWLSDSPDPDIGLLG